MKRTSVLKKLVLGVSTCAVALGVIVGCNVQKSYAAENPTINQEQLQSMDEDDAKCEEDMYKHVTKPQVEASSGSRVWRVYNKETDHVIKKLPNGNEFSFEFNIRGWVGNSTHDLVRHAQVQFFYNSKTKQLVFLTFGNKRNDEYRTYSYSPIAVGAFVNTIFEDTLKFGNDDYCIADDCEHLIVDPTITSFGRITQQCFHVLKDIDTAGQDYAHCSYSSSTNTFGGSSFRHIGSDSNRVDMKFLNCFTEYQCKSLGEKIGDWAPGAHIKINGVNYDD